MRNNICYNNYNRKYVGREIKKKVKRYVNGE